MYSSVVMGISSECQDVMLVCHSSVPGQQCVFIVSSVDNESSCQHDVVCYLLHVDTSYLIT